MVFKIHHQSTYLLSIYYSKPPPSKKERKIKALVVAATFFSIIVFRLASGTNFLNEFPNTLFFAIFFSIFVFGILTSIREKSSLKLHLDIGERKIFVEKTQNQELQRISYDIENFLGLGFHEAKPSARYKDRLPANIFLKFDDKVHDTQRPSKKNLVSKAVNKLDGTKVSYWRIPLWETEHPTTPGNAHEISSQANKWLEKYLPRKDRGLLESDSNFDMEDTSLSVSEVKRDFSDLK